MVQEKTPRNGGSGSGRSGGGGSPMSKDLQRKILIGIVAVIVISIGWTIFG